MLYIITCEDIENSISKRLPIRAEHLLRLQALAESGRLIVAGPTLLHDNGEMSEGVTGSVIIAEFASLSDAEQWAQTDPYQIAGIYKSVSVKPLKKVLP